jgi:hypothetical protein
VPRSDGVPSRPALTIELRRAVRDDLPAIRTVVERAYEVYIDRIGRRPAPMDGRLRPKLGRIVVALAGGVIGLIVLDTARDHVAPPAATGNVVPSYAVPPPAAEGVHIPIAVITGSARGRPN